LFTENRFSQFPPIHELGKIQRQALNLAALRVGYAKERKYSGQSRRSTRGGALGPGAALVIFGLFLLPAGRLGRRFTGADDEDPAAAGVVLFLLPRGRPRPRSTVGEPRSRRDPSAPAMWKSGEKRNPR
jgi:hypothetical protein